MSHTTLFQKEQVRRLRTEGMGYSKIAACLGISENTVKSHCKRNNLSGVMAASNPEQCDTRKEAYAFCKNCGKPIGQRPGVKPRKFCSDECRMTWWNNHPDQVSQKAVYHLECSGCKKPFDSYGNKHRKYCSHACYIRERFRQPATAGGEGLL
ncbi:RNA polymerase subunit sigma-70 [Pelotomaculum propionicicum]